MHEVHVNFWLGVIVPIIGFLVFHGSVYVLVALNVGWRFGYWVTSAAMGALMLILSLFWVVTELGPRGEEQIWYPIAASSGNIESTTYNGVTFDAPAAYPGDPWKAPSGALKEEIDPIKASLSNCTSFDEKKVKNAEKEIHKLGGPTRTGVEARIGKRERLVRELQTCSKVFTLLPSEETFPMIDGSPVAVVYDATDIRLHTEDGTLISESVLVPNTYDKRVTGDPEGRKPMQVGKPFKIVSYLDKGSLRMPSLSYLVVSLLYFAFHLMGLSRAEKRKLSPVAA